MTGVAECWMDPGGMIPACGPGYDAAPPDGTCEGRAWGC